MSFHLISHTLCPYVQRIAISLTEKGVPFERTDIDLSNKPDWFLRVSPLGKTPVLIVGEDAIFESSVILEYLEDTQPSPFHPNDPLMRAKHRSWIEFGSSILNDIAGFYAAKTDQILTDKQASLTSKFRTIENELGDGPYFSGGDLSLVDIVFAPIFRYFDTFERIADFKVLDDKPKVQKWRSSLAERASVKAAVGNDYPDLLWSFLLNRKPRLSEIMVGGHPNL